MIRRAPRERDFTVLPNAALEDERLSYRARGVLAYILSKPDHWKTNSEQLAHGGREGRDAIRTALGELQTAGYAMLVKDRKPDGTFLKEWVIADSPTDWKSASKAWKPDVGSPDVGDLGPLVSTEEQELNRKAGVSDGNQPTTEDQLANLRAVKNELRHVGGEAR